MLFSLQDVHELFVVLPFLDRSGLSVLFLFVIGYYSIRGVIIHLVDHHVLWALNDLLSASVVGEN